MSKKRWYSDSVTQGIAQFKTSLPSALIIEARPGMGGITLAHELADSQPSEVIELQPEAKKTVVSPRQIRELSERVRSIGSKRVVVLLRAELLGESSQNALLKLIEEPQQRRHFIIVAPELSRVLPTIRSRAQTVSLLPLTQAQSQQLLDSYPELDQTTRDQVYFLAAGLPVRMRQLVENPEEMKRSTQVVTDAKAFLFTNEQYEKMQILQPYTRADRDKVLELLRVLMTMSQFVAKRADDPRRELRRVQLYSTTWTYVERYGNIRLAILSLVV